MRDDEYLRFTEEGFEEFVNALTDYPQEQRRGLAAIVAYMFN